MDKHIWWDHFGIWLPIENVLNILGKKRFEDLKNRLTINYRPRMGNTKATHCFFIHRSYIVFPRSIFYKLPKLFPENLRVVFPAIKRRTVKIAPDCDLTVNQHAIVDWLSKNVFPIATDPTMDEEIGVAACESCVLNLQAGLGKTYVAGGIFERIGGPAVFITPRKHLAKQAKEDLEGFLDKPKIEIYSSQRNVPPDIDILIIVINSAIKLDAKFYQKFRLIFLDEIHMYCSDEFRKVFIKAQARYLFGFSATTDERLDELDPYYKRYVGDVVYAEKIPGFDIENDKFKGLVKIVEYYGPPEYTKYIRGAMDVPDFGETVKQISEDPARNALIVKYAVEILEDPKRFLFIFVEHRDHANLIFKMIPEEFRKNGVILIGGAENEELVKAANCRFIITTYSYGGTGISYQRMNAAIFATPRRNNYKQICRRVTRKGSDTDITRIYIDIVDMNLWIKSQLKTRSEVYKYFGFVEGV